MQPCSKISASLLAALCLIASPLFAQATSGSSPATKSSATSEEETPIELSPFTVTAEKDFGYLAGNTLAGSRLNTPLKDTAASISVFTEEFMKDIAAIDLDEVMEYANNSVLGVDDAGSFGDAPSGNPTYQGFGSHRVRGMEATRARNYFEWMLPVNTYNIGRIDDSRGPNSVLFGIGSAGGTINASTKQPVLGRSMQSGTLMTDNHGSLRGTLDFNRSLLDDKLGLRLDLTSGHTKTSRLFAFNDTNQAFLSAKYRPFEKTTVRAEYERGKLRQNIQRVGTLLDVATRWLNAGRPTVATSIPANAALGIGRFSAARRVAYIGNEGTLIDFSLQNTSTGTLEQVTPDLADYDVASGGPGAIRNTKFNTYSVFIEQQLGKRIFLEAAYNHQDLNFEANQPFFNDATQLRGDPNQTLKNGAPNPHVGQLFLEGFWFRPQTRQEADNYRVTATTSLDAGKWGNYRFAAMGEYAFMERERHTFNEVWAGRPFNVAPESPANIVYRRNYVTEGDWDSYYIPGPEPIVGMVEPVTGQTLTSTWVNRNQIANNREWQRTLLLGAHARYLNNRLVIGAGLRRDLLKTSQFNGATRDPDTNEYMLSWDPAQAATFKFTGETRSLGLVAHLTKRISLIYNQASNLALPNTNARVLPDSTYPPPPEGDGKDIGFSIDLIDGKLFAKAVYYESAQVGTTGFGFGGTNSSVTGLNRRLLSALEAAEYITAEEKAARDNITQNQNTLDRRSEGYEFSLVANPTKGWRLQANFSITDHAQDNTAPEIAAWVNDNEKGLLWFESFPVEQINTSEGITMAADIARWRQNYDLQLSFDGLSGVGNRKYKVNVFTRYSVQSGKLKGLYFGGGYRHQSKLAVGRYLGVDGEMLYGNSFWVSDALLGYQFRRTKWLKRLDLQLNVTNLFDDQTPLITRLYRTVPPTVQRFSVRAPRAWRLTASYDF